jgi:hypothetical protein
MCSCLSWSGVAVQIRQILCRLMRQRYPRRLGCHRRGEGTCVPLAFDGMIWGEKGCTHTRCHVHGSLQVQREMHLGTYWLVVCKGSVQTDRAGRDCRTLYARWQTANPGAFGHVPGVHGLEVLPDIFSAYCACPVLC